MTETKEPIPGQCAWEECSENLDEVFGEGRDRRVKFHSGECRRLATLAARAATKRRNRARRKEERAAAQST